VLTCFRALDLWQLNQIYRLWDGAQLRGTRQREEPHCCAISDLLNFLPQPRCICGSQSFCDLSFRVVLDWFVGLELRFAAVAIAKCDWCKFDDVEKWFRHDTQL
jgi:hypothetical protein